MEYNYLERLLVDGSGPELVTKATQVTCLGKNLEFVFVPARGYALLISK